MHKTFDRYMQILRSGGIPEEVIHEFERRRSIILDKVRTLSGWCPAFIPVVPFTVIPDLNFLMGLVRYKGQQGYSCLDLSSLCDTIETPDRPYFILRVRDGSVMRRRTPNEAKEYLERHTGPSPLTTAELIALCIFGGDNIFVPYYVSSLNIETWPSVCAANAYYETNERVPLMCLDQNKRPKLTWTDASCAAYWQGAAFCHERF